MNQDEFMKLQNGSDIRGVALAEQNGPAPNLTPPTAAAIGAAFAAHLAARLKAPAADLTIAVGRDPRLSGPALTAAIADGLAAMGCRVLDCGLASTPAMFMATLFPETDCDGAVMITASHLPGNRNGCKFFDRSGGLQKEDITAILRAAWQRLQTNPDAAAPHAADRIEAGALMPLYERHLRQLIIAGVGRGEQPLAGMKITVDAGNGSGGFFAEHVLRPLGADTGSSQFLEPDGRFPNHVPNPEDADAMASVSGRVRDSGADLGLIFDTDVDRSAAVDQSGQAISRNSIVALAASLVAADHPGTTVVTDSITSDHLTAYLEQTLGLRHFRYRRGYRNVINKALELNAAGEECWLAIETSGHAAMKENYFLDDGAYLAARIVIKAAQLAAEGRGIDSALRGLRQPLESTEIRMPLTGADAAADGGRLLEEFSCWAAERGLTIVEPSFEGVRLSFPHGWCLLRRSLHDPIMPLNIESDEEGGVDRIILLLREFFDRCSNLDTSQLQH